MKSVYHYTSLETLALILKNQNLAFKKLIKMDDHLEKFITLDDSIKNLEGAEDGKINMGDFCFVSCWSYESEESISMWDMYGDRKQGVRIELPSDMLDKKYDIFSVRNKIIAKKLIPKEIAPNIPLLIDVVYGDDEDAKLKLDDGIFDKLGKYKTKDWAFQKECRFRIFAHKTPVEEVDYFWVDEKYNFSICEGGPIDTDVVFFGLSKDALSQIRILVGPEMSKGKRILLDSLARQFDITSERINDSKFTP